jgi:uncharacterized protein (DUF1697 family)
VPTHVALLRGINVGGHNRVAMADLRAVVAALGHGEVATYIQSGNVVFGAADPDADSATLAATLERAIAAELGVRPRVVVLSRAELAAVVAANPFPTETNPKCLHALFRGSPLHPEDVAAIASAHARARQRGGRDEARVEGSTLFLRTPDGLGRSELAAELTKPKFDTTARNWATVTRLLSLVDA